jgi:hypothetical protein
MNASSCRWSDLSCLACWRACWAAACAGRSRRGRGSLRSSAHSANWTARPGTRPTRCAGWRSFLEWLNERDAIKQGDLLTRFQKQKEDADKALAKLRSRWLDVRLKAKWAFSAWQELLPALPEAEQSEQTARLAALMARWSAAETVLDEDVDDIIARWLDITVTTNDVQRDLARDASGKHRSWAVFFPTQDVKKESATIAEGSVRLGRNTALQFEWSREIDDRVRALTQPPSPPPSVVPSVAVPAVMGP